MIGTAVDQGDDGPVVGKVPGRVDEGSKGRSLDEWEVAGNDEDSAPTGPEQHRRRRRQGTLAGTSIGNRHQTEGGTRRAADGDDRIEPHAPERVTNARTQGRSGAPGNERLVGDAEETPAGPAGQHGTDHDTFSSFQVGSS